MSRGQTPWKEGYSLCCVHEVGFGVKNENLGKIRVNCVGFCSFLKQSLVTRMQPGLRPCVPEVDKPFEEAREQ